MLLDLLFPRLQHLPNRCRQSSAAVTLNTRQNNRNCTASVQLVYCKMLRVYSIVSLGLPIADAVRSVLCSMADTVWQCLHPTQ